MLYKNLLRISMDADLLKNLISSYQNQTPHPPVGGIEPRHWEKPLTPENLKKSLEEFLTICARRAGMERVLAIRQRLQGINYSKKTIAVEFFYSRPPDGKLVLNQSESSAAQSFAPPAFPPALNRKKSNRFEQLDSLPMVSLVENGGKGGI